MPHVADGGGYAAGTTESPLHTNGRVVVGDAEGATSPESLRPTDRSCEARWKATSEVRSVRPMSDRSGI
jgi:hypothetical protein